MKEFTFSVPQENVFGSGSLNRLPELLKKKKAASVLLVSGPHLKKMGIVGRDGKYESIYRRIAAAPKAEFSQDMLAEELRRLAVSIGIPETLAEVGVDAEKIPEMAADAMKSGNIHANPRMSTQADIEMLYRKAMGA